VRIALEGWPGPAPTYPTLGYAPEVWRALFQALPSPAFGLCYDPSHLVRLGIDYLRVLEEFGERIHYCHGKDTALQSEAQYRYGHLPPALDEAPAYSGGAWRYCVPGSGVVQWGAVVYGLERAGYHGAISIELEDARYRGSAEKESAGIAKAAAHLRQAMA
jgi:sugar phosphate isomerase/epimerase